MKPQNGQASETALDLWGRWSALVLVRAALRRHPSHAEILPAAVRKVFKPRSKDPALHLDNGAASTI